VDPHIYSREFGNRWYNSSTLYSVCLQHDRHKTARDWRACRPASSN